MPTTYTPRFPELLRQWQTHDLAKYRPAFYEGLCPQDELIVWQFIEEQYLLKYSDLVLVAFEWSAEGLWGIPFPGSVQMGRCMSPEDFNMPPNLVQKIKEWHDYRDANARPGEPNDTFDYKESHAKGFEVAMAVKLFLGNSYYVEYHPFREIKIVGGVAVETEIPDFIRSICKPQLAS